MIGCVGTYIGSSRNDCHMKERYEKHMGAADVARIARRSVSAC